MSLLTLFLSSVFNLPLYFILFFTDSNVDVNFSPELLVSPLNIYLPHIASFLFLSITYPAPFPQTTIILFHLLFYYILCNFTESKSSYLKFIVSMVKTFQKLYCSSMISVLYSFPFKNATQSFENPLVFSLHKIVSNSILDRICPCGLHWMTLFS